MKRSDIKPVWLLIAQCHYSIALGSNRSSLTEDQEKKLFVDAIDYLYKTYGVDDAKALGIAASTAMRMETQGQSQTPLQPLMQAPQGSTSNFPAGVLKRLPQLHSAASGKENKDTTLHEQLRILKSAHEGSLSYLNSVQRGKQDAEDALNAERRNGRELAARLRDVEEQIRALREEAQDMRNRIKQESEARHAAEAQLARDAQAARIREDELREETTKFLLQKLSRTLGKVAENPSSMKALTNSFAGCKEEQQDLLRI